MKAIEASLLLIESTFQHKMEVYRRWGLTDDEIMLMFRLDPLCIKSSEKKIMSVMVCLVNEIDWEPAAIARCPSIFARSLEKKIIPRCSVLKVLQMKGLVKKDLCLFFFFCFSEKNFLDVPELLNVYQGKIGT